MWRWGSASRSRSRRRSGSSWVQRNEP
jgi:hypothetical protein